MAEFQEHIPPFPPEFGEDKGEFFKHYDKIQDELDNEMVKRLKENLDGLLVFAGLFAGVNSAFLAFTLDLMSPEPIEDISSLLQQIMEGLKSPMSLPSMSFTPPLKAVIINALFTLSLASALFAAFFAVLGKQWLMLYRNRNGGGVDQQRWEQLRRSLGAERWGLVPVLEVVLPLLIQTALLIFAAGFVSFLRTTSETLATFVLVPLVVASFLSVLTIGFSLWDVSCPFRHPLSEIVLKIPLLISAITRPLRRYKKTRAFRRHKQTRAKNTGFAQFITNQLSNWRRSSLAGRSEGVTPAEDDNGVGSGSDDAKDEETGQVGVDATVQSIRSSRILQTADQRRPRRERWRLLIRKVISRRRQAIINSKTSFWNLMASLKELIWGFQLVRGTEDDRVLQVESIKRVINISEDPKALYHAALNLRSITDLDLLELVYEDESTTRGLRECYLEALDDFENKHSRDRPNARLLRETLAFGTAFFHVSLSAPSFDDFITMIGIKGVTLPPDSSEMSEKAAQVAGNSCRQAHSFLRKFIWLQMRGLGPQPMALTSTTLAAVAFWYAINGIPHSQDVVYGSKFREALVTSEISWAGLELLAFVSNLTCRFPDTDGRKPYTIELDWCRSAFLRVRDAYSLSEPTQELAEEIRASFNTGKNLETNAILFKFAWKLFTRDDGGDHLVKLGEQALSAGYRVVCAIERAIRSMKVVSSQEATSSPKGISAVKAAERYEAAREMCFTAMLECMGPRDGKIEIMKRTAWRQRLTIKTATAYMNDILNLEEQVNDDGNAFAKKTMDQIRQAQIGNLAGLLALVERCKEYVVTGKYSICWDK
ncbi:hypothetical protein M407DRAFT_21044 [Tulasnella calospora MUT 4182]|uniref:DUF6535 domain-containing protein n=1 Tax=Tulasnella calospora MUT 4182 TaxID=1051891 RepID=A0A0C3QEV8_9AGAM|nr:hypothetical protein M407DRAFT_21044 [Tulasnella calospora MUT 4182]